MNRLVINGCSYVVGYADGNGHVNLAKKLGIAHASSLAIPGSCNTRILRTTIKDSYQTLIPTLYVVGLTFLLRSELPISATPNNFEKSWISIGNYPRPSENYSPGWSSKLVQQYIDIMTKAQPDSVLDRLEDLMYLILRTITDLKSRGHQVLIFAQVNKEYRAMLEEPCVKLLKESVNIVDGLGWSANRWQFDQGVPWNPNDIKLERDCRHPLIGQSQVLTDFLFNYIQDNKLI